MDPGGRYIILLCEIESVTCTIVNVYVPNSRQISFLNKVKKKVERIKKGAVIWCGDFNAIVDSAIDSTSICPTPPIQFHSWLLSAKLYDVWRCRHAAEKDFTFYSNPHRIFTRIDMFRTDHSLLPQVKECSIDTITWSDHAPIPLSIALSSSRPAPFSWQNNTFILSNPKHQKAILDKLIEYFTINSSPTLSNFTLWNAHKAYMRGFLLQLSSRLKREKNKQMQDLLQNIQRLEHLQRSTPSPATNTELLTARLNQRQHLQSKMNSN